MTTPKGTPRACGCGCGVQVARRYAPGHDARHKSALVAGLTSADWRTQQASVTTLLDLGWLGFAPLATLRSVPQRTPAGMVITPLTDVTRFQVDHRGGHHANRRCPALTRVAREVGAVNRVTRLAEEHYVRMVDATPDLIARLPRSWDQCTTCTTDLGWDEIAQSMTIRKEMAFEGDRRITEPERIAKLAQSWEVAIEGPWPMESSPKIACSRNPITGVITRTPPTISPWGAPAPATRVA